MSYFTHLQLKMRSFFFIIKSIKFCTPIPEAGNLVSSLGVSCLWYIPETHEGLPRSLQRKSICLPEETILHHHFCSCGFTVELLKTGSPSNSFSKRTATVAEVHGRNSWSWCGYLATQTSDPIPSLCLNQSLLNLKFPANLAVVPGSWRRMRRLLFPSASSSISGVSETRVLDL